MAETEIGLWQGGCVNRRVADALALLAACASRFRRRVRIEAALLCVDVHRGGGQQHQQGGRGADGDGAHAPVWRHQDLELVAAHLVVGVAEREHLKRVQLVLDQ